MSDTPRTNKEQFFPHDSKYQVCDADFARQLERELIAANESFRKLNIHTLNLVDRIRRLEDAGDRMRLFCADPDDCFAWDRAKETKP